MIEKLFKEQWQRAVIYAEKFIGNEAEDIVQESFICMLRYQLLEYEQAKFCLFAIIKRKCINHIGYRNLRRYAKLNNGPGIDQIKIRYDTEVYRKKLKKLPPRSAQFIELMFFEDYKACEIRNEFGLKNSTVYTQINMGLEKLKSIV